MIAFRRSFVRMLLACFFVALLPTAVQAQAQAQSQPPAQPRTILFVGNSFTFGAGSAVMRFRPWTVTDLNNEGIGGVPALFKAFAEQARLDWHVSLETSGGEDLAFHLANKRALIDRSWDVVLLQGYSTLDRLNPGRPGNHVAAARALAAMLKAANPRVQVDLVSTWSRADQTYLRGGRWFGKTIYQMSDELEAENRQALVNNRDLHAVIPVGGAWNRAIRTGVADSNPYDGIAFGKADLWTWDQYHASALGYYLEALVIFGAVTRVDPRTLPERESAAADLGLDPRMAARLRVIAAEELNFPPLAPPPPAPSVPSLPQGPQAQPPRR